MKKIAYLLPLCFCLLLTSAVAEGAFPDLPEDHWAYSAVEVMRQDGRVNGFPDGEFKPDELVTRWQFAKMAGGNPDEILDGDRASTRDEAIKYLWTMAGSPQAVAPAVITEGSDEKTAVAWGYTKGIMQGDDGVHMRLKSTLTRAEASALIVRAQQPNLSNTDFRDVVNEKILEQIWDSFNPEIPYSAKIGISNGYLARLAVTIGNGGFVPEIYPLQSEPAFEGNFARDWQLVCQECLGIERATEEQMKATATKQDVMAVLSFYTMRQSRGALSFDGSMTYPDATLTTEFGKLGLQFARYNDVFLYADDWLQAEKLASMRDIACILLQLDEVVGYASSYGDEHSTPLSKNPYSYPSNAKEYRWILEEIPVAVYETPLVNGAKTVESFEYASKLINTYSAFVADVMDSMPDSVEVIWAIYPSLIVRTSEESVIRVKLHIKANPENLTLNQMLPQNTFAETYTGSDFMVDISTNTPVMNAMLDAEIYKALRAFSI